MSSRSIDEKNEEAIHTIKPLNLEFSKQARIKRNRYTANQIMSKKVSALRHMVSTG